MRAVPTTMWKLMSVTAVLAALGAWAISARARDDGQAPKKPAAPAVRPAPATQPEKNTSATYAVDFRKAPWDGVLEWFSKVSDLAMISSEIPKGSFSYISPDPNDKKTIAEIVDILNDNLQAQKYTLIRHARSFSIVSADQQIDPSQIQRITVQELPNFGETELVSVAMPLTSINAEEIAPSLESLLGPFGKISAMSRPNQLVIQDVGRTVKRIVRTLQDYQNNDKGTAGVYSYQCNYIKARDAVSMLRELFGLPKDAAAPAAPMVPQPGGFDRESRRAAMMQQFQQNPQFQPQPMQAPGGAPASNKKATFVYADERLNKVFVSGSAEVIAQAEKFLKEADVQQPGQKAFIHGPVETKMYTVPTGSAEPIAKMLKEIYKNSKLIQIDSGGNNTVLVLAPADDQLEIGKRILDTTAEATKTERIRLNVLDAGTVVERLREMFGIDPEKPASMYIGLDADSNALIVRGSDSQVKDVKAIITVLGDNPNQSGPMRIISSGRKDTGAAARELKRLIEQDRNIPVQIRLPEEVKPAAPPTGNGNLRKGGPRLEPLEPDEVPAVRFTDARAMHPQDKAVPEAKQDSQKKPVTISVVGDSIVITCDDPETLNYVHDLALKVIDPRPPSGEFEVIRLKRASAVDTAKILDEFFNGPKMPAAQNPLLQMFSAGGGGGRGMAAIPQQTAPAKNKVRVIADPATNSLLVRASSNDRRIIHDILKDFETGNDEADALIKPYIIGPFKNTSATEVANVIRDVFAENMNSSAATTMMGGMRGFGGRFQRPGGGVDANGNPRAVTLSVAVDDRSNSLIVNATKAMFDDIKLLADRLDDSASASSKTIRVVSSKDLDPYLAQQAVAAMQGQSMSAMSRPGGMQGNMGMNNMGMNPMMGRNQFGGGQFGGNNPMMNRGAGMQQFGGGGFNQGGGRGNMMMQQPGMMSPGGGFNRGMQGGGNFQSRPGGNMTMPGGRTSAMPAGGGQGFFAGRVKDDPEPVLYDPQLERDLAEAAATAGNANGIQLASHTTQIPSLTQPQIPQSGENLQAPRSGVTLEPIPELGVFIVTGNNQADVEAVIRVIELMRQLGTGAQLRFELVPLSYADPINLATSLQQTFAGVAFTPNSTTSSRQQQTGFSPFFVGAGQQGAAQGSVAFFPVPRLSSLFLIAPEARIADIKDEIRKFDRPIANNAKATQIFLKKASATQVAAILNNFYAAQPYGPEGKLINAQADVATNSIIVQAAPADIAQIREIVGLLDSRESNAVNDLRIVPLKNQLSDDLAALLQQTINQAVGASSGTTGQAVIPGLQQNATTAGVPTKNTAIRVAANGQAIQSGWLQDVYVQSSPRINSLIVMAPEKTMEMLLKLIESLDVVPKLKTDLKVFALTKSDANAMANLLQSLFLGTSGTQQQPTNQFPGGQFPGGNQARTTPTTAQGGSGASTISGGEGTPVIPIQLVPDPRTNSIIVAGSAADVELIHDLIRFLEDTQAPERMNEVYHLRNAQAPDVANALTIFFGNAISVLSRGNQLQPFQSFQNEVVIIPEAVSNRLLISATPRYFPEVMRLIHEIDQEPPQVVVHALIAQVDLTGNEEFGVEIGLQSPVLFERGIFPATSFIPDSSLSITAADPLIVPPGVTVNTTNPVAQPGFNFINTNPLGNNPFALGRSIVGFQGINTLGVGRNSPNQTFGGFTFSAASDSFNLLVRALKQQGRIQVLSRPMLMTLDRQSAFVLVGQDFPYVTATNVNLGVVTSSVDYRPVGVQLTVTPSISPDGKVVMRVRPEISSVGTGSIPIGGGAVAVPFNVQTVETTILAEDGETVVVGGLITHRDTKAENKIPWLGDLPGVGVLFRYRTQAKSKSELIVILTPRIVYTRSDTEAILAEEARKMDWLWSDALRLYDFPALQALAPQKGDPQGPNDASGEFAEPGDVYTPGGPALGEPVYGEPIQAPRETVAPPMQQQPMPPQRRPQAMPPQGRPQPMPDGPPPAAFAPRNHPSLRGAPRPGESNVAVPPPEPVNPRFAKPMPNAAVFSREQQPYGP